MSKVSDAIEALDWLQVPEYAEASRKTIEQAAPRMAALLTRALPWLKLLQSSDEMGVMRELLNPSKVSDLDAIIAEIEGKEAEE